MLDYSYHIILKIQMYFELIFFAVKLKDSAIYTLGKKVKHHFMF